MARIFSFLIILTISFSVQASIMERFLAYETSDVTYDNLPCINPTLYEQLKSTLNFNDDGIEGQLCGDGSLKEKIGRYLNMFWEEISFVLNAVSSNPEEALAEPRPYLVYQNMRCISEKRYQYFKNALKFDDSNLLGGICDGSLRSRVGKLMGLFETAYGNYWRAFKYDLASSLIRPHGLLISDLQHYKKYEGSLIPPADAPVLTGPTEYAQLPCISEDLYEQLKEVVGVDDTDLEGTLCGDDSNKERFGKLLLYLRRLAIPIPNDWKGGASDALTNPLNYIADGTHGTMTFADESGAAIASNLWGSITIYKRFFLMKPIDAISVLVHEARHSASEDPGHEVCTAGDRARQSGACDKWLDTGKEAGAYSYNISFYYGIAKYGLASQVSEDDREFLRSTAISLMARRFNGVPDFLGLPFETVHILDSAGDHYYVHPITKKKIEIPHEEEGLERIRKIKFDRVGSGLRFFTEEGRVYDSTNFNNPIELYDPNVTTKDMAIRDMEKLTGYNTSIVYFVTEDNVIRNRSFDLESQVYSSEASPFQYPQENIVSLIDANDKNRYALTQSGLLLRLEQDSQVKEEENNMIMDKFQDPAGKGWRDITGGLLYTNLFGINQDQELYLAQDGGMIKVDLDGKVQKYRETTNFALIQRDESRVDIKRYGEEKAFRFELGTSSSNGGYYASSYEITSATFTRHFRPGKRYHHIYNQKHEDFVATCSIVKLDTDPWTGKGMGLTAQNELVFEGPKHDRCMKYEIHGAIEVTNFRFVGTSVQEPGTFSTTALEIFTEGKWRKIYPYDWRKFPKD